MTIVIKETIIEGIIFTTFSGIQRRRMSMRKRLALATLALTLCISGCAKSEATQAADEPVPQTDG